MGGKIATRDDRQRVRKRPRSVRNEHVDETDAPCRDNGLGGDLDQLEASRGVEIDWSREMVVDGTEYDRIRHGSDSNGGGIETNTLNRVEWPGG